MKEVIKRAKRKLSLPILFCLIVFSTVGITFAWFRNLQQLNTVALVQIPSKITLSGANRSELQRISLELTADDTQNGDQVTLRRVFCIESTADFWLEVARTTNIENMDINIYPVQASNSNLQSGVVKGTDGVDTFYYTPDGTHLQAGYINEMTVNENGIGIANSELHTENYDTNDVVQKNAEPLYWRISNAEDYDLSNYSTEGTAADGTTVIYYRYYVLELSWSTSSQETDLVYLLASHVE